MSTPEEAEKKPEVTEKKAEEEEKKTEVAEDKSEVAEDKTEVAEDKTQTEEPKAETTEDTSKSDKPDDTEGKTDDTTVKEAPPTPADQKSGEEITKSPEAETPGASSGDQTVIPIEPEAAGDSQTKTAEAGAVEAGSSGTAKKKPFGFFKPYQPTTEKIEGQSAFKRCYTGKAVWISVLVLLIAILILIACAIFIGVVKEPRSGPLVSTECGKVEGTSFDGGFEFRGIPYAVPPVGSLRWKPPKKPNHHERTCWKGTLNATTFGNSCFQSNIFLDKGQEPYIGSEDCLFLNVWTPTNSPKASLPVAVFVHGGSLANFNGNWPRYRPNYELARTAEMVLVSMNYRLSALGFLALDLLSEHSPNKVSGNYGFMDIQLALKWVRTNIHNFGGDPNQVALYGHSSGATAVMALMTSPLSEGLFHRAWISSGSGYYQKPLAEAAKDNLVFLKTTGCSDIQCLYRLSPGNVTDAAPWHQLSSDAMTATLDLPEKNETYGAICVVDGYVIPYPPLEALTRGLAMKIPLLIGSTAEETDFYPVPSSIRSWNWDNYTDHVAKKLDPFNNNITEQVLQMYPPSNGSSVECVYSALVSDIRVNCPLQEVAYGAANSIAVYSYVITYRPSQPIVVDGFHHPGSCAAHFLDIFALFGNIDKYIEHPTEDDWLYQNAIRAELIHFLQYGRPKSESWRKFPITTARVDKKIVYRDGVYKDDECAFWRRHGFYEYSWSN